MSLSPINILQRLQELKSWQQNHESLLKKSRNFSVNDDSSAFRTIEGLSEFDSPARSENVSKSVQNWEAQAISPTKTFHELLEEKLAEDPGPASNVENKPKKPFLRKGTGLQRFKVASKPPTKPIKVAKKKETTPLRAPDLSIKPKAVWSKPNETDEQIRKINDLIPKSSEQSLYEKALEKELLIFEALEEKVENSSFCSTNSSVLRILSSTPSKNRQQSSVNEERRVHWETPSEIEEELPVIESNLEKREIAEILLRLQNLATNKTESTDDDYDDTETSTSVSSTDFECTLRTEKRDVAVGTTNDNQQTCQLCDSKLHQTIVDYERKIFEIVEDKKRINKLKCDLEDLEKQFVKKEKEFEDEKKSILFELEKERKQLIKERQLYQNYQKEKNRPNKKDREEINNLKQEVADLRETLKLKESKNGMTQARLRNQIKQLEKENSNLKQDLEKLTKDNAKLTAAQKLSRRPSSESKILQEINKNINKLTLESTKNKEETSNKQTNDNHDSFIDLERQYVNTFRENIPVIGPISDKIESVLENGSKQTKYSNGNIKTISADGNLITMKYFNGDIQETNLIEGIIKYYFFDKNIWQTTYADGVEFVEFPDGIKEKRYRDGTIEVTLPDGVLHTTYHDGTQEIRYPDGSLLAITNEGDKILHLPNGQKEIETKEHKRREYPDGTVKILHLDGTQETRYSNGRVRIKDKNGKLILDTQN